MWPRQPPWHGSSLSQMPVRATSIEELRDALGEKGVVVGYGTIRRFFARWSRWTIATDSLLAAMDVATAGATAVRMCGPRCSPARAPIPNSPSAARPARPGIRRANGRLRSLALGGFRPGVAIFTHRRGCAAFERGGARSADSLGRHKPDQPVAALTECADALALNVLEEGMLLGAIDNPEAEVVLVVGGHF
jgi:hypothetical protein